MNCNEVRELLMPFHDGELDPAVSAEVERALVDCPECSAELAELRLVHAFASDAFTAPVADVDLSGFTDGVMARVAAEQAEAATATSSDGVRVKRAAGPGLLERLSMWFGEVFRLERPLAAAVGMAAILAVIAGVWFAGGSAGAPTLDGPGHPTMTADGGDKTNKRRGREGEVAVRSAYVEESIAAVGEVKVIDLGGDSDDEALVLWHVVEGEGVTLPANGNGTGL